MTPAASPRCPRWRAPTRPARRPRTWRRGGSPRSWPPRAARSPASPSATAWNCWTCSPQRRRQHQPVLLPAAAHAGDLPAGGPAHGPGVQDARAAGHRAAGRPLPHRLPAGPRPDHRLPAGTPAGGRPRDAAEPVPRPGRPVLARPGDSTIPGSARCGWSPASPRRGSTGSPSRRPGPRARPGRSPRRWCRGTTA